MFGFGFFNYSVSKKREEKRSVCVCVRVCVRACARFEGGGGSRRRGAVIMDFLISISPMRCAVSPLARDGVNGPQQQLSQNPTSHRCLLIQKLPGWSLPKHKKPVCALLPYGQ